MIDFFFVFPLFHFFFYLLEAFVSQTLVFFLLHDLIPSPPTPALQFSHESCDTIYYSNCCCNIMGLGDVTILIFNSKSLIYFSTDRKQKGIELWEGCFNCVSSLGNWYLFSYSNITKVADIYTYIYIVNTVVQQEIKLLFLFYTFPGYTNHLHCYSIFSPTFFFPSSSSWFRQQCE